MIPLQSSSSLGSFFSSVHTHRHQISIAKYPSFLSFPRIYNPFLSSQMFSQSQSHFLSFPSKSLPFYPPPLFPNKSPFLSFPPFRTPTTSLPPKPMISNSKLSNHIDPLLLNDTQLDRFAEVGNKLADAAGEVIRAYFRKKFEILDKEDLSKSLKNLRKKWCKRC